MIMGLPALMRLRETTNSLGKRNAYVDHQAAVVFLVNVLSFAYQKKCMVLANTALAKRFEISLLCTCYQDC